VIDLPGLLGLVLTIRYRQPLLLTQNIFTSLGDAPALVDGTALAYVLSRCVLRTRLPAILPALIAGLAIAALDGEFRQVPARLSLGTTLLVDGVAVIVKQR
jgi:predicted benzoate:H+ symporter BenE